MDREFHDSGFLVRYRPGAVALLPWWKAGTVCLWPPGSSWLGDGLTDVLLCSSILDIVSRGINSPLTAACCLEFAEALAGTSGLRCAPTPSQECVGDSSAPSPSPGCSGLRAPGKPGAQPHPCTCPSSWSGQASCQACYHLHLSHSHAEPQCMGLWALGSMLRRSSKPPV